MKRLIIVFSAILLFGCGILKTGRSPAAVTSRVEEVVKDKAEEAVRKHVNAFSAEDLYRSRADKLRRNRRRAAMANQKAEEAIREEPVSQKNIVEIIQIIDDSGAVVASKKVK